MNCLIRCFGLLSIVVLASCSKVTQIQVKLLEPGGISVPPYIKTVALVNRSLPPDPQKKTIVGIFTGETVNRDIGGSQEALTGLQNILTSSPRYFVKMTGVQMIGSQFPGNFPDPLDSGTVRQICRDFQADAVIALEDFGATVTNNTAQQVAQALQNGIMGGIGAMAGGMQYTTTQTANVKLGFRIYDPTTNNIDDQFFFSSSKSWTGEPAMSIVGAVANASNNTNAINQTAFYAGQCYGRRIAPMWAWEWRTFYKRSKNAEMGMASRMAMTGDWKGAMDIWNKCSNTLSRAKAGRAAFNMALGYEVMGDLEQAQQWCEKSYAFFNNRQARVYAQVLKQRAYNVQRVQQQMQ